MSLPLIAALVAASPATAFAGLPPAGLFPGGVRPASLGAGVARPQASTASAQLCARVAAKAGFSYNHTVNTSAGSEPIIVMAVAIALAESSCNPSAQGFNGPTSGCPNGSVDRGLWQVNSCYHSEVSNACAYQAQCNADAAYNISGAGSDWSPWSTYGNGAYISQLPLARASVFGISFQLKNTADGTCLDADAANVGNGGKIFQWTCNSSDHFQQWVVTGSVGHLFILRNVGSRTCLDADGGKIGNAQPIFQWACNANDAFQQWWFLGSGQYNTNGNANANLQSSGARTCLDADGAARGNGQPIFQWTCSRTDHAQWWS